MLTTQAFFSILEDFAGSPVSLHAGRCLNARLKSTNCEHCGTVCPSGAIVLQDGRPELDTDVCVGCGACLHGCPTEAFVQPGTSEALLATTVTSHRSGGVLIACPIAQHEGHTRVPVAIVVTHSRCLASIAADRLLEMSFRGEREVWLDDGPCRSCPLGDAAASIHGEVGAANRLLAAFGRDRVLYTVVGDDEFLTGAPQGKPVVRGDQPHVSRRGLLSKVGRFTQQTAARMLADQIPRPSATGSVPVAQRLPHRVPATRERLYRQLVQLPSQGDGVAVSEDLPIAQVVIDEVRCSACSLCARFCPTGALQFRDNGERFELEFRPAVCIDCGVCEKACVDRAVGFAAEIGVDSLVAVEPEQLIFGMLVACMGCGTPTATKAGNGDNVYCFTCRDSGGPTAPLKDTAGLLADLAARLPPGSDRYH